MADNDDLVTNVMNDTLDTLAAQDDAQQLQQCQGRLTFNPSVFQPQVTGLITPRRFTDFISGDARYLVLGPFRFDRRFAKPPSMAWDQQGDILSAPGDNPVVVGTPTADVPFLVQASPRQWIYANGEVDGFYVGLYALTVPPLGLINHTVTYLAVGEASRYTTQDDTQAWTGSYDNNTADFLQTDDSGSPDEEMDNTDDFT